MIARLNAMYQRSTKVLVFLVVIFLAVRIANAVMAAISLTQISVGKSRLWTKDWVAWAHRQILEEVVLSGTYGCNTKYAGDTILLYTITWILAIAFEIIVLCLAVWIAIKQLRELRQHSTKCIFNDHLTIHVLMKTHLSYFARWAHNVKVVLFSASAEVLHMLVLLQFPSSMLGFFLRRSQRYVDLSSISAYGRDPSFS